jgi:hypothetical protein
MADNDLRPEQVAKLVATPPLPTELVDEVLDATDAERAAAAAELADRTRQWLESIGALKPSASVFDLDYRRLSALAAVWATVEKWWRFPPYQQHSLGMMLKIIPATMPVGLSRCSARAGSSHPNELVGGCEGLGPTRDVPVAGTR